MRPRRRAAPAMPPAATARSSPTRSATLPDDRRPAGPRPTFEPDLRADRRRWRAARRRPRRARSMVEDWNPYRAMFDVVWAGRAPRDDGRHQIDRYGNQNIACIGDWRAAQGAAARRSRGAPGNTINHTTSYWVPQPLAAGVRRARRRRVRRRLRPGRGARPGRALPRDPPRRDQPRRASTSRRPTTDAAALAAPRRHRRRGRRGHRLRARDPARRARRPARPPTRSCAHPRGDRPDGLARARRSA